MKKIGLGMVLAMSLFSMSVGAEELTNKTTESSEMSQSSIGSKGLMVSVESGDFSKVSKPSDVVTKTIIKMGDVEKVLSMTVADMNSDRYKMQATIFNKVNGKWVVRNQSESTLLKNSSFTMANIAQIPVITSVNYDKEDKSAEVGVDTLDVGHNLFVALQSTKDENYIIYNIELSKLVGLKKVNVEGTKFFVDTPEIKTDSVFATARMPLNKEFVLFENADNKVVLNMTKESVKVVKSVPTEEKK